MLGIQKKYKNPLKKQLITDKIPEVLTKKKLYIQ